MNPRIKTYDSKEVTYTDHVIPVVHIPDDIKKYISADEKKHLEQVCLQQYVAAKKSLNESIADVTSTHKQALAFAGELARRTLTLIDIAASLDLDKRMSSEEIAQIRLEQIGVDKTAIEARSPGFLNEVKKGVLKRIVMSGPKSLETGNVTDGGYVGMNSLAIAHAAEGNLRERMYIPFKSTWNFTANLLSNKNNVDQITHALKTMNCHWQLNTDAIEELKSQTVGKPLYQLGAYAASREASRTIHSDEYKKHYQDTNPTIQELNKQRIPLSQRELLVQSGDLNQNSDKKVMWLPGEAWFGIEEQVELFPDLKAARESGEVMVSGMSGATDGIFSLSYFLGLFNGPDKEQKMRDALTACLGWMIDGRDHTAHEILTSVKSFGLNYTPGPDSYQQIRPGDKQFEDDLRAAQKKRGYQMPDEVLKEQSVRKIANDLFPQLSQIKSRSMKTETLAAKEVSKQPTDSEMVEGPKKR